MTDESREALLERDWASVWESLPEAPPLVPRAKTAQVTLRIPPSLLERTKAVAAATSLPYHTQARAWIVEGLRSSTVPRSNTADEEPQTEQLNIKVDNDVLDLLKARAHELHRPYHRLARDWIENALAREEERLGIEASTAGILPIKDLMVLLLHAKNKRGQDAIQGIMRLQKLLFVIEQKLGGQSRFYAYNYGPFNEEVNDAAHALRIAGFLHGAHTGETGPPSFEEMLATVEERSGPRDDREAEEFDLTEGGHEAAEQLRRSDSAYDKLYTAIKQWRADWDTPDILQRVYATYPKFAERSLIRDRVAQRNEGHEPPAT